MASGGIKAAQTEIPISAIVVGPRLRAVDPAAVANMAVAIEESEFFGSILVRPIAAGDEGEQVFELVAGAHRLAAMRQLGRATIPATIRVLTDDQARLIEIDENLVRRGLTPLERAEMVMERFPVWARRFPDRVDAAGGAPKRGRPKNSEKFAELLSGAPAHMGFAAETAADVGLSEKTIRNAVATVNGLPADLRAKLRGTDIARNEGLLRQLAGVADRKLQAKVAEALLAGTKGFPAALAQAMGRPIPAKAPKADPMAELRRLWKAATPSQRRAMADWVADQPIGREAR